MKQSDSQLFTYKGNRTSYNIKNATFTYKIRDLRTSRQVCRGYIAGLATGFYRSDNTTPKWLLLFSLISSTKPVLNNPSSY